jgi:hypothetical protein
MVEHDSDNDVPADLDASDVVVALIFVAPESTGAPDGRLVQFVVKDATREDEPIVDA